MLKGLPSGARAYILLVLTAGLSVLVWGVLRPESSGLPQFICYLLIAMFASLLKVHLPGIMGTMSVNFLFILLGVSQFSFAETLLLGCGAVAVQCFYRDKPRPIQVAFNICATAISVAAAYAVYHLLLRKWGFENHTAMLVIAAAVYFVFNTGSVAIVIALTERKVLRKIWVECYFWSLPYYLFGAALAGVMGWVGHKFGWEISLLILPVIYLVYKSYSLYLGRLQDEKQHAEQVANLHLRTIEALALAIEAKDQKTHDHLQRVGIYAVEVAKELKMSTEEIDALRAAALLHDIGKLGIPEHIVSKPGRLTPEEFEKIKIHPIVGADILERVRFPYPVTPIVRAHHEKWNGSGYPYGLCGEQIPIGARILSAVDFLDALATDRQYREGMRLEDVIRELERESGQSFDPQIVNILQTNYRRYEQLVRAQAEGATTTKLTSDVRVERGSAPATGFEETTIKRSSEREMNFLTSIAAARYEAQTLFELSQDLGASLSLDETLSVFAVKLKRLVPYDAIVIYIRRGPELVPQYVSGDNFRVLSSLRIPVGAGISGWVAENKKPLINGNPVLEPGYKDDERSSPLSSALAIPVDGLSGVVAVLTVYASHPSAYTSDHVRILQAISSKMGLAIENALKYQQAENSATTDYLTGLPNARSLFLHLEHEIARCRRDSQSVAVLVCDMNGFKQINDRFGHLEGNRVLRLFAQTLKHSCREYDYVARMGGDEFVVITPGLPQPALSGKIEHMKKLARYAGQEICNEEILSLSVGTALYPEDGHGAEQLLAEADRRMYQQKQKRPSRTERRLYPRSKCHLSVELQSSAGPIIANLKDLSLGGAYVETSSRFPIGTGLQLVFDVEGERLPVTGTVVRSLPGRGVALNFATGSPVAKEIMDRVLAFNYESEERLGYASFADALNR